MSVTHERLQNLVGGEFVDAAEGGTAEILNPATGETIAEVPEGTQADVERAVEAAKKAWPEWRESTPAERAELLLELADLIDDHADELAELESQNVGKPLAAARDEMPVCADNIRFFAGAARVLEGRSTGEYMRGYTSWIRREPVGVVGQIAPWNYPLMMAVWKFAPALAAGNVSVLKPSEQTPLSTLRFAQLASELIPPGVLNVVTGDGEPVGAGIVRHPDVRMVSLTGDVATGKEVARAAAETLKRVHLELGGKAPVIVFDDADPAQVAEAIKIAGYWNSGQDCTAASRVVAGPKIYDKLLEELVPAVESIGVGDPAEGDEIEMGPVISKVQQDRVLGFLDRATSNGATVLAGGTSRFPQTPSTGPLRGQALRAGFFVEPTIVVDVDQTDEIVQREVFGPVVTVQRFADDDQALAWANDVPYGLSASVFTRDIGRALNAARKLEFGTVWINDHIPLVSEMPHGGFKQSGYGKDLSTYSLEDYTQVKHVMAKLD
jgi:1-pyrroline dehydrogenase